MKTKLTHPVKAKITHPDSLYYRREGNVLRISYGTHVDLLMELADGLKITVDAKWTDYRTQTGGDAEPLASSLGVEQARRVNEILRRWKTANSSEGA